MAKTVIVKITTVEFVKDVNSGMTKTALMEKYGINQSDLKKVVTAINAKDEYKENPIKIKKEYKQKFQLIDTTETVEQEA